jgi:hypothetical protein
MQHHEEALADTVTLAFLVPQTCPFAKRVGLSGVAASDGLVDAEIYLNDSGGSLLTVHVPDADDFAGEDDACKIRHVVKNIFECLRESGGGLTSRNG